MQVCPNCLKKVESLTRDHIVPKWFYNRIQSLGLDIKNFKRLSNYRWICEECNKKKAGQINWENEIVRDYMNQLANAIKRKLSKT